ncbi:serine acetyltransferase 3, mitochondrial-like [Quercus robur]|uniref:serine acetyltransferase 3, mitochondrial-like n=1 Tax=Quercus robur TaxID=38942 RepID=UPI00216391AA|nr:serine acetyltransferase 3, mitochondrial-like [Quercus robur]
MDFLLGVGVCLYNSILSQGSLERALANHLSMKLSNSSLPSGTLFDVFQGVVVEDEIMIAVMDDLRAVKERDPACVSYVHCFLNFKGFLACQVHRVAHKLWSQGRKALALLIQNRVSEVFEVDIQPGAKIGRGILFDHATGVVIGETAVIGNDVSILHNVTLGGTGKACGDRHPKIGDGVLIGAGTCILGNIGIGDGAKIGAGSVVLKDYIFGDGARITYLHLISVLYVADLYFYACGSHFITDITEDDYYIDAPKGSAVIV